MCSFWFSFGVSDKLVALDFGMLLREWFVVVGMVFARCCILFVCILLLGGLIECLRVY